MSYQLINSLLIVSVFWAIVCLLFGGILWALMPGLDKRPKKSVRCRKCWYDLRACMSDQCPECGIDLSKNGVWPNGKPNRRRLLFFAMPCFYLCSLLAVIGSMIWGELETELTWNVKVDKSSIFVFYPQSELYHGASFSVHGVTADEFYFGEDDLPQFVDPLVSIHLYADGKVVQAITVEPRSKTISRHTFVKANVEEEQVRKDNGIAVEYGTALTPELLGAFYVGEEITNEKLYILLNEMDYLIRVAEICSNRITLSDRNDDSDDVIQIVDGQIKGNGLFNKSASFPAPFYYIEPKSLPGWLIATPSIVGAIMFLASFFLIRRLCYARDMISWESVCNSFPASIINSEDVE